MIAMPVLHITQHPHYHARTASIRHFHTIHMYTTVPNVFLLCKALMALDRVAINTPSHTHTPSVRLLFHHGYETLKKT
eukprot:m.22335 g.22335  ORF g.22335 m.22335 type:complete len:78 (-) comp8377_c0_seq2:5806-6039(-)